MEEDQLEGWYSAAQAARILGVSRQRLHQMIGKQDVETYRIGNTRLVPSWWVELRKEERNK